MPRPILDESAFAAGLAEQLARELGIRRGSLWIPGTARRIQEELRSHDRETVEEYFRMRLGLAPLE